MDRDAAHGTYLHHWWQYRLPDPQLAGPPGGTRTITPDILAPFNGKGDTQLYYTVNDGAPGLHGGGGILKTRKSAVLTVQVGPRIADMPKPELQGRIGNNVNPSHVVGNPLLTLPYTGTLDKDRIHWTIVGSALGGSDSGVININPATAGQALNFNVGRKILDLNLNGSLRILYSLERDGPPKVILRSEVLDLTVGAGVFLGRPVIVGASLSPEELNPLAALAGATVLAQINPTLATDRINFDWFSADGIGSTTLDAPGNAATHETSVTFLPRTIAQCIREGGSTIDVQYRFYRGSFPYHSEIVSLRLLPLTGLPTPYIEGVGDSETLLLSQLVTGARIITSIWHFINAKSLVWLRCEGVYESGGEFKKDIYIAQPLGEDGAVIGLQPLAPVEELKQLRVGSTLHIKVWIGFAESPDKSLALLFPERLYKVQLDYFRDLTDFHENNRNGWENTVTDKGNLVIDGSTNIVWRAEKSNSENIQPGLQKTYFYLKDNTQYELSFYYKATGTVSQIIARMSFGDVTYSMSVVPDMNWEKFTRTFTTLPAPPNQTQIARIIFSTSGPGIFSVDQIQLHEKPVMQHAPGT